MPRPMVSGPQPSARRTGTQHEAARLSGDSPDAFTSTGSGKSVKAAGYGKGLNPAPAHDLMSSRPTQQHTGLLVTLGLEWRHQEGRDWIAGRHAPMLGQGIHICAILTQPVVEVWPR